VFENFKKWCQNNNVRFQNICLAGGCALNVLLNQKLLEFYSNDDNKIFIPPNPDDGGLALGQIFLLNNEKTSHNVTFNGLPILDSENIDFYLNTKKFRKVSINELSDLILDGKIIGIINGDSEVGPRALGNRSIVCDPSYKNMKDILNSKVKFREWYRPFAPVCRDIDSHLYFETDLNLSDYHAFMSYSPKVKKNMIHKLPSITHNDESSRLQIVSNKNSIFYQILNYFNEKNKIPVLLNTSFNIKGNPILSSLEDAFKVLNETELDAVYYNGILFEK